MSTHAHIPIARCDQSRALSEGLWSRFELNAPSLPRYALTASAVFLAHEHHSSIFHLVRTSHGASAAALIRPLFEAVVTSAWVLYVAPVEQIEALHCRRSKIPELSKMIAKLEARSELKGKLGLKDLMAGKGRMLHEFTHGEMEQLLRRFRPESDGAIFSLKESYATLVVADLLMLLGASIFAVFTHSEERVSFIGSSTDALMAEVGSQAPGVVAAWQGWKPFPQPKIPLGIIPQEVLDAPRR